MLKINSIKALKLILLFSLINSSTFIAFIPQGFSLLRISIVLLLLISVVLLFTFFIKKSKEILHIHLYFRFLFTLLLIWSAFTIFRSISFNSKDLISLFGHYLMAWAWITPLAIIFGLNIFNWIEIFNFLGKLLLWGVIFSIFFILTTGNKYTGGVVEWVQFFPILLLTYMYQQPLYKKVTILAFIAFIILSIYNEQRVNAIYITLIIFFMSIEYLRYKNKNKFKKIFFTIFLSLFLLFISLQIPTFYNKVMNNKSASTDTRTFLFVEMFGDMSTSEQIIGRGALGTYYSPYFEMLKKSKIEGGDSSDRSVNEIGYLEMILKGGYIMMMLYLLILIPSAYLGIFKSKNTIAKMSGYTILLYLIIWSISYYSVYSAEYLLLWMAVGTTVSPIARKKTDEDLKFYKKFKSISKRNSINTLNKKEK